MKRTELLKKLKQLGYPLFEPDEAPDVNEALAEVVKSNDPRLWEGFPLLLANGLKRGSFGKGKVESYLDSVSDKTHFRNLALMSLALYRHLDLKLAYPAELNKTLFFDKKLFGKFAACFVNQEDLPNEVKGLSPVRVVRTFERYYGADEGDLKEYDELSDRADFEYALSQVFSAKQKELFLRKLKGGKMTKTEREYYSRSVRKKVLALANDDLHKLSVKLAKKK